MFLLYDIPIYFVKGKTRALKFCHKDGENIGERARKFQRRRVWTFGEKEPVRFLRAVRGRESGVGG
jgi:hypothetical protein